MLNFYSHSARDCALDLRPSYEISGPLFPKLSDPHDLLDGNGLFAGMGYDAVSVAGLADVARVSVSLSAGLLRVGPQMLKWLGPVLAVFIAILGFYYAFMLQGLP